MYYNDNNCLEHYNKVRLILREIRGTRSDNEEESHECAYGEPEVASHSAECQTFLAEVLTRQLRRKLRTVREKFYKQVKKFLIMISLSTLEKSKGYDRH